MSSTISSFRFPGLLMKNILLWIKISSVFFVNHQFFNYEEKNNVLSKNDLQNC